MATIIKTDGYVINIEPKDGKEFSLEEMQTIVSGYIEIVDLHDGNYMVVNEEGKLKGLAINHVATQIYTNAFPGVYDVIVGDVLVCNKHQIS